MKYVFLTCVFVVACCCSAVAQDDPCAFVRDADERLLASLRVEYGELFGQRRRAVIARDGALRDAGLFSDFTLINLDLERVCLEIESVRLSRATTDPSVKLTPDQARQRYVRETERIIAHGKQPAKALADLKSRVALATQLLAKLKVR